MSATNEDMLDRLYLLNKLIKLYTIELNPRSKGLAPIDKTSMKNLYQEMIPLFFVRKNVDIP